MDLNVNVNVIIASKDDVVLLEDVLSKLGKGSYTGISQVVTPDIVQPVTPVTPVTPVAPTQTATPVAPVQTVTPVEPVAPTTQVPVSEKTYTLEDIQRASAALVQGGKIAQLQALLQQFNAISLAHLSQDNFGAFALKLRELGADI